jgi:DNA-binding response OmpR family regulator
VTIVLVADDDIDICNLLTFKLEQAGHVVRVATNGVAAMDALGAGDIDLALLDVMMPGMSGLEICLRLRAQPATADLPVILVTARAGEADVRTGYDVGADDYLVKPFSPRELISRVQAVLHRGSHPENLLTAAAPA